MKMNQFRCLILVCVIFLINLLTGFFSIGTTVGTEKESVGPDHKEYVSRNNNYPCKWL